MGSVKTIVIRPPPHVVLCGNIVSHYLQPWRTLPFWLKAALFEWPIYAEGLDDPLAEDLLPPRAPTNQL